MYRGVFFDYDFTLGDSSVPILYGFRKGFAALGLDGPEMAQVRPTIGMTLQNAYAFITGDSDPHRAQIFADAFHRSVEEGGDPAGCRVMIEESRLFPGAAELLDGLREKGVHTAIVSTKRSPTIRAILTHAGVTPPEVVIGGGDVQRVKPDPEGLRLAMEALALAPEEVLFCGDTVIDAQAAQNAGVDFCPVLLGTTPLDDFQGCPRVFQAENLRELAAFLGL